MKLSKNKKVNQNLGIFIFTWAIAIVALVAMIIRDVHEDEFEKMFANKWFLFSLGAFSTFFLGWKYLKLCFNEIFRWHKLGMNVIIVLSTELSLWFTLYQNITGGMSDIVEASIFTILFLETGDLIRARLEMKATSDLATIVSLQQKEVIVEINNQRVTKKLTEVAVGEIIAVGSNQIIPLDGKLLSNITLLNTQIVNGENDPREFKIGDTLFSGMINLSDEILIEVIHKKSDSLLSQIIKQIDRIQFQKSKLQNNIDKIIGWFAPTLFLIAIVGFIVSYFVLNKNETDEAFRIAITILVAACPCALGIAIPMAVAVGSAKAAKHGVVFNKTDVFYRLKKIKFIAFDKTGTLTSGRARVTEFVGDKKHLPIIGKMEELNGHTLSRATIEYLAENNFKVADNELIKTGERQFSFKNQIYHILKANEVDESFQFDNDVELNNSLKTTSYFAIDHKIIARISYEDTMRDGAKLLIKKLKEKNITPIIISGDNKNATAAIADELGISDFYFDETSESKANIIASYQKNKKGVAFVGDGMNDTVAIEQSDLSISIVSPTSYAKLNSDLTLIDPNLEILTSIFSNLATVKMNILINLMWAMAYNIFVIPMAFLSFINPLIGMAAMFLSSVLIVLNTLFFKFSQWKL